MTLLEEMIESEQRIVLNVKDFNNDGDHDRFAHYFSKKAIGENLLEGKPMRALCGKVVERQVDPKGRTVCAMCKDVYDNVLKKG